MLVTAEREGILEPHVVHLRGESPVIELPVSGAFSPNIYISALAVRGRIAGVKPTAMVDLGKPTYKLGIAEIRVGWKSHALEVAVDTDHIDPNGNLILGDELTVIDPATGHAGPPIVITDATGAPISGIQALDWGDISLSGIEQLFAVVPTADPIPCRRRSGRERAVR